MTASEMKRRLDCGECPVYVVGADLKRVPARLVYRNGAYYVVAETKKPAE